MEVFSSGTNDLNALVMFVLDATRPFTSPAKFERGEGRRPFAAAGLPF
jgi:hypothetical protein